MVAKPTTRAQREAPRQSGQSFQARRAAPRQGINGLALMIMFLLIIISVILAFVLALSEAPAGWIIAELLLLHLAGFYILFSLRIANQWEKAIVLRMGRFRGLRGPGPFWIRPV